MLFTIVQEQSGGTSINFFLEWISLLEEKFILFFYPTHVYPINYIDLMNNRIISQHDLSTPSDIRHYIWQHFNWFHVLAEIGVFIA